MNSTLYSVFVIGSIGIPWLGSLLTLFIDDKYPRLQKYTAVFFSVLAALSTACLIFFNGPSALVFRGVGIFGNFSLMTDGLAILLAIIATVIGAISVIFSTAYMNGEKQTGRYYSLVLFFIGSMVGLVLSSNLFYTFVFWEITAVCSYALISFYNDDPKAVRGGMKAFIITQLGGVGLLAGAMILYTNLHTLDIPTIMMKLDTIPANVLSLAAFGFLFAAVAKSAQVPLHTWLPDAMEAPTPISALIHAATMVNAGVYLLARFYPAFSSVPGWREAIIIISSVTALLAAVMAAIAFDLKRVLAYSTISQLGYMVYAVGVGNFFGSQFHLLSHALFKALLFLSAGAIIHSLGTRDMRLMGGLGKQMPLVRTTFLIGALALAGIPFFNGFWSKDAILTSGFENGPLWAYLIMLLTAGITAFYTMRCVWMVFYGTPRTWLHPHPIAPAMKFSLILLAFGTSTSWLLGAPLAKFLASSLPFHTVHDLSIIERITEVFTFPMTYVTFGVIALGLLGFMQIQRTRGIVHEFRGILVFAENGFGFEFLNDLVSEGMILMAEGLRYTQTGILNWNIFGILVGLIALLSMLELGGV